MIGLDYRHVLPFVSEAEIHNIAGRAEEAARKLTAKTGPGNEFWVGLIIL